MELRKWRLPVPLHWQNIMLSKPSDDIPALSEGDIDDLIKTFGHKKRDKKQKNVKKFYNSPAKQ